MQSSLATRTRLLGLKKRLVELRKFDPAQARDERGRWTDGGGDGPTAQELLDRNQDPHETYEQVYNSMSPQQRAAIEDAKQAVANGTSTKAPVSEGGYIQPDGTYTPERQALHQRILDDMFTKDKIDEATPKPGEKPELIMTGGRPASGKTSALQSGGISTEGHFYISADTIQEKLPGYNGKAAGLFNPEAQDIAAQAERAARELGLNITYDATMKTKVTSLERVDQYKAAGYDVSGYFSHTSPRTSAIRSVDRYISSGRFVPPEVSFNSRSNEATFDALKPKLTRWALFDNNGPKPRLVAHS